MTKTKVYIAWFLILATACGKEVQNDHAHHVAHDSTKRVEQTARPANRVVISAQKTIKPSQGLIKKKAVSNGYIAFDERRNNKVSVRISGRIEKLYVKYNYQYVKRGQPIAELYSPELSTYQEEYLFLLKSADDNLARNAKQKLELLGLTGDQIQQLEKSGIVQRAVSINSLVDGFIRFSSGPVSSGEMTSTVSAMGTMTGTSSTNNNQQISSAPQIREGMYVNKGQTLFVVNDCQSVWAILSVDNYSQADIKKGDSVVLFSEVPGEPIHAKIDLVEPFYQGKQRFTQARIHLDNPLRAFKINSLITGEFSNGTKSLTVPESSVYDLGTRKIVWVKTGITSTGTGLFEARIVVTRFSGNGFFEILDGLTGQEEIALNAGYMLDRESILNDLQ